MFCAVNYKKSILGKFFPTLKFRFFPWVNAQDLIEYMKTKTLAEPKNKQVGLLFSYLIIL